MLRTGAIWLRQDIGSHWEWHSEQTKKKLSSKTLGCSAVRLNQLGKNNIITCRGIRKGWAINLHINLQCIFQAWNLSSYQHKKLNNFVPKIIMNAIYLNKDSDFSHFIKRNLNILIVKYPDECLAGSGLVSTKNFMISVGHELGLKW